jgi:O-antigen ligase
LVKPAIAALTSLARRQLGSARLSWYLPAVTIVAALVLGGGTVQGLGSDAVVQFAGLPLLGLAVVMLVGRSVAPEAKWAVAIAAGIILLPLIQLMPLPPDTWTRLPGRSAVVEIFEQAAIPLTWRPISLDPAATWRSALSLLPPLAVFLAVLCTGMNARRKLILLLVGFAVVSVALGLLQLMQGPASPLRFHAITNPSSSVGMFANRNHHAALLYSVLPFAVAWTIGSAYRGKTRGFGLVIGALTIAALLLGLGMAQSRAGVILGLVALVLSIFLLDDRRHTASRRQATCAIFAAGVFGALLVVHYGLPGLLNRFEAATIDDYRFEILRIGLAAAETFLPFGSGFGTFEAVYQMHDRPDTLLTSYVNHAHNDWLELWIEGGWLIAPIAAGFLLWLGLASYRAWRFPSGRIGFIDVALRRAASISVFLLLLHSLADYPLRTTSLATVFALCCALLVRPVR